MSVPNEIKNLTEAVVSSFESGIGAVGHLIEKGLELLDGYRSEQEAIRGTLRESLASVGNLRRKDFDGVMEKILEFQSSREREIRAMIYGFLKRQQELTARLKRSLEAGILVEVDRVKGELSRMIGEAREGVLAFQKEQELIRETFANLEGRREGITTRELKKAIQDLEGKLLGETVGQAESAVG